MQKLFVRCIFILCVATVICLLFVNYNQPTIKNQMQNTNVTDQAVILLWTTFFGESDYLKFPKEDWCIHTNCLITSNRSYLRNSDAIIFHANNILDFPTIRLPHQYWIWFNLESPASTSVLSNLNGKMNWTATYRLDSDIPTPYASVRRLGPREVKSTDYINYATNKSKMVVWFVSNCHTSSQRESYVRELQKYVQVDIYGACGDKQCMPKMSAECYQQVSRVYRFYLSFENSYCKDYVTEKFFHILQTDMIPVVFGGANYSVIAPKDSYIDTSSFSSPAKLARYLSEVASNDTMYNSYFKWKNYYAMGGYHWSCELCRKLHQTREHSVYYNLDSWWSEKGICKMWIPNSLKSINI